MTSAPLIRDDTYDTKEIRTRYCNGIPYLPGGWDYQLRRTKSEVWQNRLPEHRAKPTDLKSNLTSQSFAYHYVEQCAEVTGFESHSSFCAGAGSTLATYVQEFPIGLPIPRGVSKPEPDWITPLRTQINDMYVNVGEDLAEYKETASMFVDAGRAALEGWRVLRGRHRTRRRKKLNLCSVANAELIYSFGVAPLVGTLFDSYITLQNRIEGPIYFKFVQKADTTESGSNTQASLRLETEWYIEKFAKVYVQYKTGSMITLGNPLSIAWELVPYSFVFDYLIPVGDTLMALDALASVENLYGTVTTREVVTDTLTAEPDYMNGYTLIKNQPGWRLSTTHQRDKITTIPLPPFPKYKMSTSARKIGHMLSLLTGANQRCKTRTLDPFPDRGR